MRDSHNRFHIQSKIKHMALLLLLLSATALQGCAISELLQDEKPLYHSLPLNHFVSPETSGRLWGGRAAISYGGLTGVRMISDLDDMSYNTDTSIKTIDGGGQAYLDLGVAERFDLFYENGMGIKWQFAGSPRTTSKKGDHAMSFALSTVEVDTNLITEDTTGSVKRGEGEIEGRGWQAQLLYGQRTTDQSLVYTGLSYTKSTITNVHIFQTNNTNWTYAADVNSGKGESYGAHVGVLYTSVTKFWNTFNWTFGANLAYAVTKWDKTWPGAEDSKKHDSGAVAGMLGVVW